MIRNWVLARSEAEGNGFQKCADSVTRMMRTLRRQAILILIIFTYEVLAKKRNPRRLFCSYFAKRMIDNKNKINKKHPIL